MKQLIDDTETYNTKDNPKIYYGDYKAPLHPEVITIRKYINLGMQYTEALFIDDTKTYEYEAGLFHRGCNWNDIGIPFFSFIHYLKATRGNLLGNLKLKGLTNFRIVR